MTPHPTPQTRREILGKIEQRLVLESGETVQHALVAIANNLGDCDDAADLAEIVALLEKHEGRLLCVAHAAEALHAASQREMGSWPSSELMERWRVLEDALNAWRAVK